MNFLDCSARMRGIKSDMVKIFGIYNAWQASMDWRLTGDEADGASAPNCIFRIIRTGNETGKQHNSYLFGEENIQRAMVLQK